MGNNYFKIYKNKNMWDEEITKNLSEYIIHKHEMINVLLNIIIALWCIFILDLEIYFLPIAYIILDIALIPLNIFFVRYLPSRFMSCNSIKSLERKKKSLKKRQERLYKKTIHKYPDNKDLLLYAIELIDDEIDDLSPTDDIKKINELKERKNTLENIIYNVHDYDDYYDYTPKKDKNISLLINENTWINRKIDLINKKIEELKKEKKQLEIKEDVQTSNIYEKINNNNKEIIKNTINELINTKLSKELINNEISLKKVIKKSKDIYKILEDRPQYIDSATTTFKIYGIELINILKNIENMDIEEKREYYSKVDELIVEYELHLDRLKEKISKDDAFKTNVDINVLMSELKKDKRG